MSPTLKEDIRQRKAFTSLQQEAFLNVLRTSSTLTDDLEELLRPYGISATQYNVLRILRGSEPGGLCRNELRDRMLTRMPDMTRLLDRLEEAGLVVRAREDDDRRMVRSKISAAGLKLLTELDDVTSEQERQRLGYMSADQLRTLIDLLALVRQGE